MASLEAFGVTQLMALRAKMRAEFADSEPATFEEAAGRIVRLLRNEFLDQEGRPECALVRVYKTHRYAELPDDLKAFARSIDPTAETLPDVRCLVLMATAGDEPAWNSRFESRGHRAIPLTSEQAVAQAPMVSQLIRQMGLPIAMVLRPGPALLLDAGEKTQNVFYVPVAPGSPYIVAQDEFVRPYGIRSVVGFGGMTATGELVAAILFSKVPVSGAVADQFKVVGLNFKLAMLPYTRKPAFSDGAR